MLCPHLIPAPRVCPNCTKLQATLSMELTRIEEAAADEALAGGIYENPEEMAEEARATIQMSRMRITLVVLSALLEVAQLAVKDQLTASGGVTP